MKYEKWNGISDLVCDVCDTNAAQVELLNVSRRGHEAVRIELDDNSKHIFSHTIGEEFGGSLNWSTRVAQYCLECFRSHDWAYDLDVQDYDLYGMDRPPLPPRPHRWTAEIEAWKVQCAEIEAEWEHYRLQHHMRHLDMFDDPEGEVRP